MNYLISDDEVQALDVLCHQLGFASGLCMDIKDERALSCTPAELYFFVEAQRKAVKGLLDAVHARHEAAAADRGMNAVLWVQALRIAGSSGQDVSAVTVAEVSRRLAHEVMANPDMRSVLNEWSRIICAIDRPNQDAQPAMQAADMRSMGKHRAEQWRADAQTAEQAKARQRERKRQRRQRAKGVMA